MSNLVVYDGLNTTDVEPPLDSVKRSAASSVTKTVYYGTKSEDQYKNALQLIQKHNSVSPLTPTTSLYYLERTAHQKVKTSPAGITYYFDYNFFGRIDENHLISQVIEVDGYINDFIFDGETVYVFGAFTTATSIVNGAIPTGTIFTTGPTGEVAELIDHHITGELLTVGVISDKFYFTGNAVIIDEELGPYKAAMFDGSNWVVLSDLENNPDIYSAWFVPASEIIPDVTTIFMYIGSQSGTSTTPSIVWTDDGTGTLQLLGDMAAAGFSTSQEDIFLYSRQGLLVNDILHITVPGCIKDDDIDDKAPVIKFEDNTWQKVGATLNYDDVFSLLDFQGAIYAGASNSDDPTDSFILFEDNSWSTVLSANENKLIGYIENVYSYNNELYVDGEPLKGNNTITTAKVIVNTAVGSALIDYNKRTLVKDGILVQQFAAAQDADNIVYSVGTYIDGPNLIGAITRAQTSQSNSHLPEWSYDELQLTDPSIDSIVDIKFNSNNEMFIVYHQTAVQFYFIGKYDWITNTIVDYLPYGTSIAANNIAFDQDDNIIFAGIYATGINDETPTFNFGVFSIDGALEQTVTPYGDISQYDPSIFNYSNPLICFDSNFVPYMSANFYHIANDEYHSLLKLQSNEWVLATDIGNVYQDGFGIYGIVSNSTNEIYRAIGYGSDVIISKIVDGAETILTNNNNFVNGHCDIAVHNDLINVTGWSNGDTILCSIIGNTVNKIATLSAGELVEISSVINHPLYGFLSYHYNTSLVCVNPNIIATGTFVGKVEDLVVHNGYLYVLTNYGGIVSELENWNSVGGIYRYNISTNHWEYQASINFSPNIDNRFFSYTNLFLVGWFNQISGQYMNNLAIFQNDIWQSVEDDDALGPVAINGITNFGNTIYVSLSDGEG